MCKKMYRGVIVIMLLAGSACVQAGTFGPDNVPDVFMANGSGWWYSGTGSDNSLANAFSGAFTGAADALSIGDFDGDGLTDMFIGKESGGLSWFESDGTPTGRNVLSWGLTGSGIVRNGIAMGDYFGTGSKTLFTVKSNGDLFYWNATGINSIDGIGIFTSGVKSVGVGYLNNSSTLDLFISKSNGLLWVNNADQYNNMAQYADAKAVRLGDFDNDGTTDMFVVKANGYIDWLKAAGVGNTPSYIATFGDGSASTLALGDVDGDGVVEMLVGRSGAGIQWYEATGIGSLALASGDGFRNDVYDMAIAVPEPVSCVLFGLAGLIVLRKNRK